jgi:hypothetical protein
MVRFIPAGDLKLNFDVLGHFYSVDVARNNVLECRSVLEIVEKTHMPANPDRISRQKPNAIFIMMNPGSSRPLVEVRNHVRADAIHQLLISLVPTKPDTTQYQVMRLMHYCGWKHVRVLNLSDLRCSKSGLFFKQFQRLEEETSFDSHSIFSSRRKTELASKLTEYHCVPVVRAWGVSPALDPLIERCLSRIGKNNTIRGLLKDGTTDKYLHPLPSLQSQQQLWVNRIVRQCRE